MGEKGRKLSKMVIFFLMVEIGRKQLKMDENGLQQSNTVENS